MRSSLVILVFCLPLFPMALLGKRVPPNPVSPVIYSGIEYSARGDGKIGCIAASEIATGKQLWAVPVFRVHPHWWKGEEDNQWIFISGLWLDQNGLTIKDERSRCYVLDLSNKRVRRNRCVFRQMSDSGVSPAPQPVWRPCTNPAPH